MADVLRAWAMCLSGIIIFGALCEMILPENSMKKYVHLAIGIMLVLALISPFVNKKYEFEFNIPSEDAYAQCENMDDNMRDKTIRIYNKKICENIKNDIKNVAGIDFDIRCDISEDEKSFGNIERVYILADASKGVKINDAIFEILEKRYLILRDMVTVKYLK